MYKGNINLGVFVVKKIDQADLGKKPKKYKQNLRKKCNCN